VRYGEGFSLPTKEGSREGTVPLPQKISGFCVCENDVF